MHGPPTSEVPTCLAMTTRRLLHKRSTINTIKFMVTATGLHSLMDKTPDSGVRTLATAKYLLYKNYEI